MINTKLKAGVNNRPFFDGEKVDGQFLGELDGQQSMHF